MTPQQAEWVKKKINDFSMPEPNSGCWLWLRGQSTNGYGKLRFGSHIFTAHRLSYEAYKGPVPEDLELDHLCRVRACVNPDHLEPVTRQVNLLRGIGTNAAKTHCIHGHPLSGKNLRIRDRDGARVCRACNRPRARRLQAKKKAARA